MSRAALPGTGYPLRYPALICLALIAVTLAVYLRAGNCQFFAFDQMDGVTNNPHVAGGLTGTNMLWAFTSVEACNWHPVTWLSHQGVAQFFGMSPRAHHLANAVIHALSASLLLLLLFRITGALWQSSFVAFLFALHPLHVESVAWVAERKDVLSAFFWFLTLYCYARYVARPCPKLYLVTLFCFLLGLMSKAMLVTLPVIMLLLDYWPLERYRDGEEDQGWRRIPARLPALIREKIPFFLFSLMSAAITIYAQSRTGAMKGLDETPFVLRLENALVAYLKYLGKTLWPSDLAVLYPIPASFPLWQVAGALLFLLLVSAATLWAGRRRPYLALGWFWYLITLVPVIGLIQVGIQSMADRYTYLPSIGLFIMVAWGVPELTRGLPYRKGLLSLGASAALIASAALSYQQLGYWRDSVANFRHTLQVTRDNYLVNNYLGVALAQQGEPEAAIPEFQEALRINSDNAEAHNNLGRALSGTGNLAAAIQEYQEALRINPEMTMAQNNLAVALEIRRLQGEPGK